MTLRSSSLFFRIKVLSMHRRHQVVVMLTFIEPIDDCQEASVEKSEVLGELFHYINDKP